MNFYEDEEKPQLPQAEKTPQVHHMVEEQIDAKTIKNASKFYQNENNSLQIQNIFQISSRQKF